METAPTTWMKFYRGRRAAWTVASIAVMALMAALAWNAPKLAAWYRFWMLFERLPSNPQGYPEYRHRETGLIFVRLPGGSFHMGASNHDLLAISRETGLDPSFFGSSLKQHRATLSPFLIAKFEVTQEQWSKIMGALPPLLLALTQGPQGPRCPIEMISWEDAQRFCQRTGLSLPSEAQWEYACRAQSTQCLAEPDVIGEVSWYRSNSKGRSHEVGTRQPNDFGLHDMRGNVEEWCQDEFDPEFYGTAEAQQVDPLCRKGVGTYVKRGGNYDGSRYNCGAATRSNEGPGSQGHGSGLRPVFQFFPGNGGRISP